MKYILTADHVSAEGSIYKHFQSMNDIQVYLSNNINSYYNIKIYEQLDVKISTTVKID